MGKSALKGSMNLGRRFLDTTEGMHKGGDDVWRYIIMLLKHKIKERQSKIGTDFVTTPHKEEYNFCHRRHINKRVGEGLDEAMRRATKDAVRNTVPNYNSCQSLS